VFLARRAAGDHDRGIMLLDQARATAARFGSHGLRRRALRIRDRAVARHSPLSQGVPSTQLTER
jgi:hypothetical protein